MIGHTKFKHKASSRVTGLQVRIQTQMQHCISLPERVMQYLASIRVLGSCALPTLCYAIALPGRSTDFRAGFWPDSNQEYFDIGPPAGRRPAGGRF